MLSPTVYTSLLLHSFHYTIKCMRKVKIGLIVLATLIVIGALTWKHLISMWALWYTAQLDCKEEACDITPAVLTIPPDNELAISEFEFDNIIIQTPFQIATSSSDSDSVEVSTDTVSGEQKSVWASNTDLKTFNSYNKTTGPRVVQDDSGSFMMIDAPIERDYFGKKAAEYITEQISKDPTQYTLLKDTLYFTPEKVNYVTSTKNLIGQTVMLLEKRFMVGSIQTELYEFETDRYKGFVTFRKATAVDRTFSSISVFRKSDSEYLRIMTKNLDLNEVTDLIAGTEVN